MLGQTWRDASASPHAPAGRRGGAASAGLLVMVALAAAGCGKGAKGDCPQLDICGGSPVGNWVVSSFCQVPAVRPSQSEDVVDFMTPGLQTPTIAPPQPNPVVAAQNTSGDWCSSLVYAPDGTVTNANLWHEAPELPLDGNPPSTMIFGADHTYLTKLVFTVPKGWDRTHFAPRCLVANGAVAPKCADLGAALNAYYKPQMAVPATFGDITCTDSAADGGCDCDYSVTIEVDDAGTWAVDPNDPTILLQDSTLLTFNGAVMNAQASTTMLKSSMCGTAGQSLELSGVRGGSLSNVQGLRTLAFRPM